MNEFDQGGWFDEVFIMQHKYSCSNRRAHTDNGLGVRKVNTKLLSAGHVYGLTYTVKTSTSYKIFLGTLAYN